MIEDFQNLEGERSIASRPVVETPEKEPAKGSGIDLKKLVIYSELMKPKFDE